MKIWRLGLGMGLERTWNYRKPWGRRFERISAALEDHQCLVTFFFFNMIFFVVVVQSLSRVGLWDPMDCSLPGSPVLCYLPEFAQIYIHWAGSQWCYLTIWSSVTPFSFCLHSFAASGTFSMSLLFPSDDQSIGASASAKQSFQWLLRVDFL